MELNIVPGYFCNLKCDHCVSSSGPHLRSSILSKEEVASIKSEIELHSPSTLMFTGGEPTLYCDLINDFLKSHPHLGECEVILTSNGLFANSVEATQSMLTSFLKISTLQMSYDLFHHSYKLETQLKNLIKVCNELKIRFLLTVAVSNPLELIKAREISTSYDIPVIFQKVVKAGRAKDTNTDFKYFSFDKSVLSKKCPNEGAISYIKGKGFSACCSSLIFNREISDSKHASISSHVESEFYKDIASKTMEQLAYERGVNVSNLSPEYSSICSLCELIHSRPKRVVNG